MFDYLVLLGLAALSGFFLLRLILIIAGVLKAPVLRQLQSYSAVYSSYYPVPAFFIWTGVLLLCGGILSMLVTKSRFPAFIPGVLCLCTAWTSLQYERFWARRGRFLFPRWYRELQERAGRDEQRRVAYAWLRLPLSTRRRLSFQDRAFGVWADLVLLSTTDATGDTFVHDSAYRLLKRRMVAS